jgi:hypothetical protein
MIPLVNGLCCFSFINRTSVIIVVAVAGIRRQRLARSIGPNLVG